MHGAMPHPSPSRKEGVAARSTFEGTRAIVLSFCGLRVVLFNHTCTHVGHPLGGHVHVQCLNDKIECQYPVVFMHS